MSEQSPRVLLSAYQCGPGMGSVSQIGWEWYSRISALAAVTLVTHVRNRTCLEAAGAPLPGTEIIYIDTEWFAGPIYRLACRLFPRSQHAVFLLSSVDFYIYDAVAVRQLRRRRREWDLVHAVTPVSPVAGTRLYRLGIPLIVGPWNGGLDSPTTFPEIMKQDSGWLYKLRHAGRLLEILLGCTRNSALILSATASTDASLPAGAPVMRMLENGVDLERFHPSACSSRLASTSPLKVIFVGRLLPFKGVALLLQAIARVHKDIPIQLTIVGDGPIRGQLEQLASDLELSTDVRFAGNLPLAQVSERMREAHLFCLPSIRESGGAVLLEAEASGIPVVAVNYGGPAELVDDEVGCLVSADGPEPLIAGLANTFRDMVSNPDSWRQRGENGRRRAELRYGWNARMSDAVSIYRQVLEKRAAHA